MISKNELRRKIVIDIDTAERLGNVGDIDVDITNGKINALIIPKNDIISFFTRKNEIVIPWDAIKAVGPEYILVKFQTSLEIVTLM